MFAILETGRLLLRPPKAGDISRMMPLIAEYDVAKNTSRVPHPYTEDDACDFMVTASVGWVTGRNFAFSILRKEDGVFIGGCGLHPSRDWEFGYWLGKPYWGHGYATEAAEAIVAFGFEKKGADWLAAKWFHDNPASGRVLEKLGFFVCGEDVSNSVARGRQVRCFVTVLDRATYMTRKKAA